MCARYVEGLASGDHSVARGSCVAAMRVCETCANVMANGGGGGGDVGGVGVGGGGGEQGRRLLHTQKLTRLKTRPFQVPLSPPTNG